MWTQEEAVALCREIERVVPAAGCHVALTGGTLYKDGARKDLDLLFYRIRQVPEIDMTNLWELLASVGVYRVRGFDWCHKANDAQGRSIDCFFPEASGDDYPTVEPADLLCDLLPEEAL